MHRSVFFTPTLAAAALISGTSSAEIFHDFTFDDGTNITNTSNTGTAGGTWNNDLGTGTSITSGVLTLGDHTGGTNGMNQSFVALGAGAFNSGTRWAVYEGVTWSFAGGSAGNDRYGFGITASNNTGGDREIAAIHLQRDGSDSQDSFIAGFSEGGGTTIPLFLLEDESVSSTGTYDFILQVDLDADVYEIFFRKDGGAYTSIGTGTANNVGNASGGAGSLYFDNNSAGLQSGGETVSFDRIYFTDVNPIPEPGSLALLSLGGLAMIRRQR